MKKIGTVNKTREILEENGFFMKKKFGQNFLIDQNILSSIVTKSEINKNINVIEIGPGIGSLTEHLLENANHVISYEIDNTLIPILTKQFSNYDNFTLINEDILKADIASDIKKYFKNDYPVYVVANLPYYITTPIIMHLLENVPEVKRYSVMVQLEVADRICANKGGKDYNNLTIAINYRAKTYKANNEKFFFTLIKRAFANRRKTLVNNLNQGYNISKEEIVSILCELNIDQNIRSEALSIEQFIILSDVLEKKLN